jgi:hypothetical protein
MNLILLRRFGIVSAAITTAISNMVLTILTVWISRKFITVRIDLKTFFYYLGVSIVMYLVVRQVETSWAWVNLALKLIIGTLIVMAGGVYKEYESLKNLINGYRLRTA